LRPAIVSCGWKGEGGGARALRCRTDARSRAFKAGLGTEAKCRARIARCGDGGFAPARTGGAPYDVGYAPSVDGRWSACGRVPRRGVSRVETPRRGDIPASCIRSELAPTEIFPTAGWLPGPVPGTGRYRRPTRHNPGSSVGWEDDGGEDGGGGGREHRLSALRCVKPRANEAREPPSDRRDARPPPPSARR
jgi:hypothetical protein